MRQIHRAGEKLFIDFAGPTMELTDGSRAHIFVAALGASSYTFACATPRETMADWLHGCARALSFFGGVPQLIVPDNPRAMIANPNRYEPRTNDTVADFARHYGTSVLPARPRHPQDKAKAESAVQVVERWILARLRNRRFFSLAELNAAIALLLVDLNQRPFKKLPGCRRSAFESIDAPALVLACVLADHFLRHRGQVGMARLRPVSLRMRQRHTTQPSAKATHSHSTAASGTAAGVPSTCSRSASGTQRSGWRVKASGKPTIRACHTSSKAPTSSHSAVRACTAAAAISSTTPGAAYKP